MSHPTSIFPLGYWLEINCIVDRKICVISTLLLFLLLFYYLLFLLFIIFLYFMLFIIIIIITLNSIDYRVLLVFLQSLKEALLIIIGN